MADLSNLSHESNSPKVFETSHEYSDTMFNIQILKKIKNLSDPGPFPLSKVVYREQDAVWAYIWAWSYYGYGTLNS